MNKYLWTNSGARLKQIKSTSESNAYNWIFTPAPGLGSESLYELINILLPHIKSNIWVADYPNDGSNLNPHFNLANWSNALTHLANKLNNVIFVSHSTGAMLLQSVPELEKLAKGFVWIASAPNMLWKTDFQKILEKHLTKDMKDNINKYTTNPSDNTLKGLLISMLSFSFNPESVNDGIKMVRKLPINHKAAKWFEQNFDLTYNSKFIPQELPCLIIYGELDQIITKDVYKNNPNYCKPNILIRSIPGASHYPWFENPQSIIESITEFIKMLSP